MARRDEEEFLAFADASRARLRRTAYLLCGDWERAADLTQEALIRVYVAWPRLDRDHGLRSYARRAVVSAAIDHSRRRSSSEVVGLAGHPEPRLADPASGLVERMALLQALSTLPPRQRACVVLRYYEDLSVEAVADALGCRPGTVKSQTARGLEALRAAYLAIDDDLVVAPESDAQEVTR